MLKLKKLIVFLSYFLSKMYRQNKVKFKTNYMKINNYTSNK